MKKAFIVVVFLGMLTWTIYEFVGSNNDNLSDESIGEEDSNNQPDNDNADTEEEDSDQVDIIGLEIGNQAPDFELTTLDGEVVSLSDYRGSIVMLNFWATWCPPCREEMPDMERLYNDTDVEILAVNVTTTETGIDQVEKFVDEYQLTFPILLDEERKVTDGYAILPLPTSFMIDKDGVIQFIANFLTYEQMLYIVEEIDRL